MVSPHKPSWLNSLDWLLYGHGGPGVSLPPRELLDEVNGWLVSARTGLQWHLNRRSLADEVESTCKLFGARVRQAIGTPLPVARRAMRDLARIDSPTPAEQQVALAAFQALRAALASDAALLAAWDDLVCEVRSEGASLIRAEQLTVILSSCLEMRDVNSKQRLSKLRKAFGASLIGPNRYRASVDMNDCSEVETKFLTQAVALLLPVPVGTRCVAWLEYEFARIPEFVVSAGDVTFYTANWALPNARNEDGQPFMFRDEMRAVLKQSDDWWTDMGPDEPHSFVIARVDLGQRMERDAIAAADELVQLLVAVATAQSGGIRWRRTASAHLVTDGPGSVIEMRAPNAGPTTTYYGMNITSETLGRSAVELAITMASRPLPEEIREAIRLMSEAGLEGSYENAFGTTRNLHARTAVALRNHAVEHIAAWGGYSAKELDEEIMTYWARSSWENEMGTLIEQAIRDRWEQPGVRDLNATLHPGGYGQPLLFRIAAEHQKEIVDLFSTQVHRERLRWLMKGLRDATHFLRIEAWYEMGNATALKRLRRVRNALVHGNPVTPAVVDSIVPIAVIRSNHSLNLAVEAFNDGVSLQQLLASDRATYAANHRLLLRGMNWLEIWASNGGP